MQLFLVRTHDMTALLIAAEGREAAMREVMSAIYWPEAVDVVVPPRVICELVGTAEPGTKPGVLFHGAFTRLSFRGDVEPGQEAVCHD